MIRCEWALIWLVQRLLRWDPVTGLRIHRDRCRRFGEVGGAWWVPESVLRPGFQVVSAGLGWNGTFEEQLSQEEGVQILVVDPTPSVRSYGENLEQTLEAVTFQAVGLWSRNQTAHFHAPRDVEHVSHSLTALQGEREGFEGICKRLDTLCDENGWDTLGLVKMDIEGAEYEVLQDLLTREIPVQAICVEFDETHTPGDAGWKDRIRKTTRALSQAGYRLVHVVPKGDYTFLKDQALPSNS